MNSLAVVILAGGHGERLGGVLKANLMVGGIRMIDRLLARLPAQFTPIIFAHGHHPPDSIELPANVMRVPDINTEFGGPLAGLAAAIAFCQALADSPDVLLTVTADTPFIPQTFASTLLDNIGSDDGVIVRYGDQLYPPNGLWRLSALSELPAQIKSGKAPKSMKKLAEAHGAKVFDWPISASGDPFINLNTLDDLLVIGQRAKTETS